MLASKPDSSLSDATPAASEPSLLPLICLGGLPGTAGEHSTILRIYISVKCRCSSRFGGAKQTCLKHSFTDPAGGHCWNTQRRLKWGDAKCQLPNPEKSEVWNGHSRDELRLAPTPTYTLQHQPSLELRNKSWQGSYVTIWLNYPPLPPQKRWTLHL